MLHNKRIQGVLYGKIIEKNKINESDLYNTSFYPYKNSDGEKDSIYLYYNQHSLMMNFTNEKTEKCTNGCYLLITYEQQFSEGDSSLIGYEFTILTRFWNYTDYISSIVDIPFNEYIIGAFEKGSISHHYYSINIPEDAVKFIIQIESNYLAGFYGEGRKRINTIKITENTQELELYNTQNVIPLDINHKDYKSKTMSFAFRPKDYYADVFSFYYFRIIYIKKDEEIYFPIDSNFGNLCIPEKDNSKKESLYYCNLILKNNYNELSTNFSISSTIQNENFKIKILKVYTNGSIYEDKNENEFIYIHIHNESEEDIDSLIFKFIFPNNEIKNIISCFSDNISNIYPQIYSSQMFYIDNSTKINNFRLKNNYTFNYQYLHGYSGDLNFSFLPIQTFEGSRNYRGKPMATSINSSTESINVTTDHDEYIYFIKLVYNMRNKGIEKIESGEIKSYLIKDDHFPLYYYFKIKNNSYINVDINLRLNSYNESLLQNDFEINGYILDEDTIKRKINGEYIQLKDLYEGSYSHSFKIGLLQINKNNTLNNNNDNYILIEIKNKEETQINSYLLVELVTKEYSTDEYFLPINHYIMQTFDGEYNQVSDENKYFISSKEIGDGQILIEISSAYNTTIKFNNSQEFDCNLTHSNGFSKYRINNTESNNISFSVLNPNNSPKTNYMIRYYYTEIEKEYYYSFNVTPITDIVNENDTHVTITLTFEPIKIKNITNGIIEINSDIYFDIYGYLFKLNQSIDEQINTTCILYDQHYSFKNKTRHEYKYKLIYDRSDNWSLTFENIPREDNFIYELQLKINAVLKNIIYNEEFLIFTTKIDLTDIKLKLEEQDYTTLIIILSIIVGVIIIFIPLTIVFIKQNEKNKNLREELKSLAYSNDIQKNVLVQDQIISKRDSDYESTFI